MKTVIGVDLGGTNIVTAVVDEKGKVLGRDKRPTMAPLGAVGVMNRIADSAKAAGEASGLPWSSHLAIGIGSPGPVDPVRGIVPYTPNLNWRNVHIVDYLKKKLHKKVALEGDANAAALGEAWVGAGKGQKIVLCVTLGTGVGGGLVLDGKVFQGATGASNHVGHIVIYPDGPKTPYGNRGVLEQYVSTKGIVRLAKEAGLKPPPGEPWEAHTFHKMAKKGNRRALRVFEEAGKVLGIGLVSTIHLINPNVVIFSGGVSNARKLFWKPMLHEIKTRCFKAHLKGLQFKMAKLGDDMGAVGAARLAWQILGN